MAYACLLSDTGSITSYFIELWLSAIASLHVNKKFPYSASQTFFTFWALLKYNLERKAYISLIVVFKTLIHKLNV